MAEMLGDYPEHLLLIGVQPVELEDYGGSLRPQVKAQISPAVEIALQYLKGFNIYLSPRQITNPGSNALELNRYENERPSEHAALRKGDARVVLSTAFNVAYRPVPLEQDSITVDVDHRGKY